MALLGRIGRGAVYAFAAIGFALTLLIVTGLALDVASFDRTRGGYEPPYEGYTGTPIDWSALDQTDSGMVHRGHVVNLLVDCESGMMTIEVFKVQIPWRAFSPRALVVHEPREACLERGFSPHF